MINMRKITLFFDYLFFELPMKWWFKITALSALVLHFIFDAI